RSLSPPAVLLTVPRHPTEMVQPGAYAALCWGAEPADRRHELPLLGRLGGRIAEHVLGDVKHGYLRRGDARSLGEILGQPRGEIFLDQRLPRIRFEAGMLLRPDVLEFERIIRPPMHALAEKLDGVAPQLVAVALKAFDINLADSQRPGAAVASFITQVAHLVGGAHEAALRRSWTSLCP